jgi:TPR repeat protein
MKRGRWIAAAVVVIAMIGIGLRMALKSDDVEPPLPGDAGTVAQAAASADTTLASAAAQVPKAETVVSESGVPIRIVRHPRLGLPSGSLGAAYAKLLPAAQAGEPPAQYQLGLVLYECRDVPGDEKALGREIETMYQTRRRGGWDIDSPKDEETTLRRRFSECAGVPGGERGKYRDWLRKSADAGLLDAELDLPLKLPQAEYCQYLSQCSPQQRAQQEALSKEAVDYLGRARDAGSASALWTFGAWYAEGEVLPKNDIEAYANFRALDQIEAASGQPRRFESMLSDLRGRLRPIDQAEAEDHAKALLSNPNCCVITP